MKKLKEGRRTLYLCVCGYMVVSEAAGMLVYDEARNAQTGIS
jgi:hypothetical protein